MPSVVIPGCFQHQNTSKVAPAHKAFKCHQHIHSPLRSAEQVQMNGRLCDSKVGVSDSKVGVSDSKVGVTAR
jgi:hypothetical protein